MKHTNVKVRNIFLTSFGREKKVFPLLLKCASALLTLRTQKVKKKKKSGIGRARNIGRVQTL